MLLTLTLWCSLHLYGTSTFSDLVPISRNRSAICLVPEHDPFDKSVRQFYQASVSFPCTRYKSFIEIIDGNTLKVNRKALENHYNKTLSECRYDVIIRDSKPGKRPDDRVLFQQRPNSTFKDKIVVGDEFVRISCYDAKAKSFYNDYKALVLEKPEVKARCDRKAASNAGKRLSVLIFGIDSVSRLNFLRHFPKTYAYLKKRNAIELRSYNKVGSGTIENMFSLLTGKVLEMFWTNGRASTFDHCDLIWKKFSAEGYRTMFQEDAPDMGMFNYEKTGFISPPTDYYYRPFATALEGSKVDKLSGEHCIGSELEFEYVLDWGRRFAEQFKNKLYFQMSFMTRLTHSVLKYAGYADRPTVNFFKALDEAQALNNTFLFFLSDHGIRYGDFRKTKIGKMEDNTPFMFILPPKWFEKQHPSAWNNLKINEYRLTTVYDIHETLESILRYPDLSAMPSPPGDVVGTSLFREVSSQRTCADAQIPESFCSCDLLTDPINVSPAKETEIANTVLKEVNLLLEPKLDKCAKLMLNKITSIQKQTIPTRSNLALYQIAFSVEPSKAQFEATVRSTSTGYEVVGTISRINRYSNQSHCVDSRMLKPFCFCKDLL